MNETQHGRPTLTAVKSPVFSFTLRDALLKKLLHIHFESSGRF